jgi:hypothetical protein
MAPRVRGARFAAAAVLLALPLAACQDLLSVDLPGSTTADAIDSPAYASLLVLSAEGDFECAYDKHVFNSAQLAGEIMGIAVSATSIWLTKRDIQANHTAYSQDECTSSYALYVPLQHARFMAEDAFKRLEGYTDAQVSNRTRLMGRAALYAGFTYAAFGDSFCSIAVDLGPELTQKQTYELAKARFTTAIDLAGKASDTETVNAAYVGRARVQMRMGETAGAVADAQRVPAGFRKNVTRSNGSNRRQNRIFADNVQGTSITVDPFYWDVREGGVADPRVRVTNSNRMGSDSRTPLWRQTKYTAYDSPIRLASYVEAQYIIAEAQGGQAAVAIINAQRPAALPRFASTDPVAIKNQVIEERRREFFLEGLRLGDLRQHGIAKQWNRGGTQNPYNFLQFGGTECFPLPDSEKQGNPSIGD